MALHVLVLKIVNVVEYYTAPINAMIVQPSQYKSLDIKLLLGLESG